MALFKTKSSKSIVRIALGPEAFMETLIRDPHDSNLVLVVETKKGEQLSGRDFNTLLRETRKSLEIYDFKVNFGFLTSVYQNLITKRRVIFVNKDGFDGQEFADKLNEVMVLPKESSFELTQGEIFGLRQLKSQLTQANQLEYLCIFHGSPED